MIYQTGDFAFRERIKVGAHRRQQLARVWTISVWHMYWISGQLGAQSPDGASSSAVQELLDEPASSKRAYLLDADVKRPLEPWKRPLPYARLVAERAAGIRCDDC